MHPRLPAALSKGLVLTIAFTELCMSQVSAAAEEKWTLAERELALVGLQELMARSQPTQAAIGEIAEELWLLAEDAKRHGAPEIHAQAALHIVRLAREANEAESGLLLDQTAMLRSVLQSTTVPELLSYRMEAYELLAAHHLDSGKTPLAAKTLEKAGSQALDANDPARTARQWLAAAIWRRQLSHAARLSTLWTRIDQLSATHGPRLGSELTAKLAEEKALAAPLLQLWPQTPPMEMTELEPAKCTMVTAAQTKEDGIATLQLQHRGLSGLPGQLKLKLQGARITQWTEGADGIAIQLGTAEGSTETSRPLRLLPLYETPITIIGASSIASATVDVSWEPEDTTKAPTITSALEFRTDGRSVDVSILGQAESSTSLGGTVVHPLYFRGPGATVANALVTSSQPCRLELYDLHSGELLAVDTSGNGKFDDEGDFLAPQADVDENGFLDVTLNRAHQAVFWQVHAKTHHPATSPVSIQYFLAENGEWVLQGTDKFAGSASR